MAWEQPSERGELESERMSAVERASEVSSAEQANEQAVQPCKQTSERGFPREGKDPVAVLTTRSKIS